MELSGLYSLDSVHMVLELFVDMNFTLFVINFVKRKDHVPKSKWTF